MTNTLVFSPYPEHDVQAGLALARNLQEQGCKEIIYACSVFADPTAIEAILPSVAMPAMDPIAVSREFPIVDRLTTAVHDMESVPLIRWEDLLVSGSATNVLFRAETPVCVPELGAQKLLYECPELVGLVQEAQRLHLMGYAARGIHTGLFAAGEGICENLAFAPNNTARNPDLLLAYNRLAWRLELAGTWLMFRQLLDYLQINQPKFADRVGLIGPYQTVLDAPVNRAALIDCGFELELTKTIQDPASWIDMVHRTAGVEQLADFGEIVVPDVYLMVDVIGYFTEALWNKEAAKRVNEYLLGQPESVVQQLWRDVAHLLREHALDLESISIRIPADFLRIRSSCKRQIKRAIAARVEGLLTPAA